MHEPQRIFPFPVERREACTSQQSYRGAIFHSHKIIDTSLGSQFSLSICFYVTTLRRTKSRAAGRRTGSFLPYSLLLPHLPANLFNKVGFASSQGTDKSLLEQKRKPLFFCLFCSLQATKILSGKFAQNPTQPPKISEPGSRKK